jgi:arylsulfatase A-like enzyme
MTSLSWIGPTVLALACGGEAQEAARPAAQPPVRPNVLVLLADDLGYGDLSCYGGWIETPSIDALARSGARFTQAYAAAAVCTPSRAGLLTGRYPQRAGVEFNTGANPDAEEKGTGLPGETLTLAERLRTLGYATGCLGKWHLGLRPEMHPSAQGFDDFYGFLGPSHPYLPGDPYDELDPLHRRPASAPEEEKDSESAYLTEAMAREAEAFFACHHDEPFFLYVAFNAPHVPYQADPRHLARFPELSGEKQLYAAIVSALDEAVGKILSALERSGLAEDTLVFFLSDNGAVPVHGPGSNAPLNMGKAFLLEGGVRVPMILRWPGRTRPDTTIERPVSLLDVAATTLGLAGADAAALAELDGRDLGSVLDGKDPGERSFFWRLGPVAAVRRGDRKLITCKQQRWLFDLSRDPGETADLSAQEPEQVLGLQQELERWLATLPAPLWTNRALAKPVLVSGKPYWVEF